MALEKKEIPSCVYLSAKKTLTIPEISEFAALNVEKLYVEADKLNLKVTGPCEFIYINCTGEMDKVFDLKVVIPIENKGDESQVFEYFESDSYLCIAKEYKGSMDGIGNAWESLINEAQSNNIVLNPQNHCREIYKTWLGYENSENVTELQTQI